MTYSTTGKAAVSPSTTRPHAEPDPNPPRCRKARSHGRFHEAMRVLTVLCCLVILSALLAAALPLFSS